MIYSDFRKAFDMVSHSKLLCKLQLDGITGKIWRWFKVYLTSRYQYVCISNSASDLVPVISGVPQGSILGPLLFAIFINDLPSCLHLSKPFIYADDTKCLRNVSRSSTPDIYTLSKLTWTIYLIGALLMNYTLMNQNLYIFISGLQMGWTHYISMANLSLK